MSADFQIFIHQTKKFTLLLVSLSDAILNYEFN